MKFLLAGLCSLLLLSVNSFAQQEQSAPKMPPTGKKDTIQVAMTEINGEMVPWVLIQDVPIFGTRIFRSPEERAKFLRLRYNVLKVLPYARYAGERYAKLQRDLALTGNKKEQRKLVKECEKEIKDLFNNQVKNLTITQGEILIKLIDRETGYSSFELVKSLKGGVKAFMFQSAARLFGHDLKEKYDTETERDIENIIRTSGYVYYTRYDN
ncbi:MAG: DUF4294 domain-containing protein [Mucilaginibacter polytrichastri]|nr:DUF4294 domain-containing protein [Mucilaginibacter polytrichastri]